MTHSNCQVLSPVADVITDITATAEAAHQHNPLNRNKSTFLKLGITKSVSHLVFILLSQQRLDFKTMSKSATLMPSGYLQEFIVLFGFGFWNPLSSVSQLCLSHSTLYDVFEIPHRTSKMSHKQMCVMKYKLFVFYLLPPSGRVYNRSAQHSRRRMKTIYFL